MPQYIKHFGASDGGTLINDVLFHFSLLCDKTKRKVFLHKCHICPYLDIHVILCLSFPTFRNLMLTLDITFLTSTLGHVLFQKMNFIW